ncbi:hypothetical protein B1R32_1184 [Abditibacterium utsteinense]|uniref:Uncharacterized protein n=1 Tax=Abditibacterium utsteinense TaxID=1960156 RepID=A0A2S8SQ32_9BACT|nr:hypothetical protein B1R32_1184 [Abditibacterium utsteinense]
MMKRLFALPISTKRPFHLDMSRFFPTASLFAFLPENFAVEGAVVNRLRYMVQLDLFSTLEISTRPRHLKSC